MECLHANPKIGTSDKWSYVALRQQWRPSEVVDNPRNNRNPGVEM